jgi:deoxyadenosine/deoxycytidine kinase
VDTASKHIVLSGLSASGKTTLVRRLAEHPSVAIVPEHNDWIGGSDNFPKAPKTIEEKQAKQRFFLRIDIERHRWMLEHRDCVRVIVSDADFTSPLAHNYAERWLYPELDVYAWLVETYCQLLERSVLAPAGFYIYLDPAFEERGSRRAADMNRRRNDMFFTEPFPTRMRRFYWILMHPDSPRAVLPALWHRADRPADVEAEHLWRAIEERVVDPTREIDVERLVWTLRWTISNPPDLEP